jgi:hypothetical protein
MIFEIIGVIPLGLIGSLLWNPAVRLQLLRVNRSYEAKLTQLDCLT